MPHTRRVSIEQFPPAPAQVEQQPTPIQRPLIGRIPAWLLPVVAVTSLLVGLVSGAIGGVIATTVADRVGGNNLRLEPHTAAPLPADNDSLPKVAQTLLPSTVQVIAEFGGNGQGATGSGWVLDESGHVITNNHVVAEAVKDKGSIEIVDFQGRRAKASVVGRSAVYDIAVLKVAGGKRLSPASVGTSTDMRVGETVVAIGSPLGLGSTVTSGILSALNRPVSTGDTAKDTSFINALQTDAAINPGNSGGPLVDLSGRVIGVNSAIATVGGSQRQESGNIGVGFAIPIEQVLTTADQILRTGHVSYPIIGAQVRTPRSSAGAKVEELTKGGPAQKAGLKPGDVIVKIDGRPVSDTVELIVAIRTHVAGDSVTLTVERDGKTTEIEVVLDSVREDL